MGRRLIAAVFVSATVSALAAIISSAGSASALAGPSAEASPAAARLGAYVRINGAHWFGDARNVVEVVLCGNDVLDGTVDCAVTNTADGGVRPDGTFYTGLYLSAPPAPCPCVLHLTGLVSGIVVDIPLVVAGVATAPPTSHVIIRRTVRLGDPHVVDHDSWTVLFGAHPRRVLVYDVTNTGNVLLDRSSIDIVWGKGADPTGFVASPPVGVLAVNQTKSFRAAIPLSALSVGSYRVVVRVDPLGHVAAARLTVTAPIPWGLVALVLLASVLVVRVIAKHGRRPVHAAHPLAAAARAGWYVDPVAADRLRLWDGAAWADQTRDLDKGPTPAVPSIDARPGWYADPTRAEQLRLWDGSGWTDRTRELTTVGTGSG